MNGFKKQPVFMLLQLNFRQERSRETINSDNLLHWFTLGNFSLLWMLYPSHCAGIQPISLKAKPPLVYTE